MFGMMSRGLKGITSEREGKKVRGGGGGGGLPF